MPTHENHKSNSLHQLRLRGSRQLAGLCALLSWTFLVLPSCSGRAEVDGTDTSTNWYRSCDEKEQCGEELSCVCGKCTLPCTTNAGCAELTDAVCISDESCESAPGQCVPEDVVAPPADTTLGRYCTPEDTARASFSGYSVGEVVVETDAGSCESTLCLVNHVQGLPDCPYGQTEEELQSLPAGERCRTSESTPSTVAIAPQHVERRVEDHIYCSCRCDGPDEDADYCTCPSGMECADLIDETGGSYGVEGSYCIKAGTQYDPDSPPAEVCDRELLNCGN